jgi:hypothetical protein
MIALKTSTTRRAANVLVLLLLSAAIVLGAACSASNYTANPPGTGSEDTADKGGTEFTADKSASTDPVDRKVIGTATADLESDDVKDSATRLTAAVEALGGYVSGSSLTELSDARFRAVLTLKVPAAEMDGLLAKLGDFGKVVSTRTSTEDVTEAYYDAQARLTNALAQEAQLLDIMKTATTVQDTLLVRAELDKVQQSVEQLKGQIRLWDALVDMATLTATLEPTATLVGENKGLRVITGSELWKGIANGFRASAAFVANAAGYLLIFLANVLLPLVVVGGVVFGIVRLARARRRAKARRSAAKTQAPPAPPPPTSPPPPVVG